MKNVMILVLLIVALIVGVLVIKDMNTSDQTGTKNIQRLDKAKEAADKANEALNRIRNTAKDANRQKSQPEE